MLVSLEDNVATTSTSHIHSPLLKTTARLSGASSEQSKTTVRKPDSGAPESSLTGKTQL